MINIKFNSKIVAFGDSITAGIGVPPDAEKWTEIIGRRLGVEVINSGIGGNTSLQGLERMDDDVLEHHPDYITICFGMNDHCMVDFDTPQVSLESFEANITEMINRSIKAGAIPILITPNYIIEGNIDEYYYARHVPGFYAKVGGAQAWLDMYVQRLRDIAFRMKVRLVDIRTICEQYDRYDFLRSKKNDSVDDGVHPHVLGAAVYGKAIGDCLEHCISNR